MINVKKVKVKRMTKMFYITRTLEQKLHKETPTLNPFNASVALI